MITKLATSYSNQGDVDGRFNIWYFKRYVNIIVLFCIGVLNCNKQLREIDPGHTLQSYSNLVYAYKVQGEVVTIANLYIKHCYVLQIKLITLQQLLMRWKKTEFQLIPILYLV